MSKGLNKKKTAVVIGAGKTGRGFIGRLLAEQGVPFVLIDKDSELVRRLRGAGEYTVSFYGGVKKDVIVRPEGVFMPDDPQAEKALKNAELVFISVGYSRLAEVGRSLRGRLSADAGVIAAENGDRAAAAVLGGLGEPAAIADAAVFCTTNTVDAVNIMSEDIGGIPYDAASLEKKLSGLPFLEPNADFRALMTRKLFTYNAVNAIITYVGSRLGYDCLSTAAYDAKIRALMDAHYEQIGGALCMEYGYTPEDQRAFALESLKKFTNRAIDDPISRNGRDPLTKLTPSERLIGSLRLIEKYGGDTSAIETAICHALVYDRDPAWGEYVAQRGAEAILEQTCALTPGEPAFERIIAGYNALR